MLYKNVYIVILLFLFFACVKNKGSNIQSENVLNTPMADTSNYLIDTDEFVLFWDKFSKALLVNDTKTLSNLIDDNFHFNEYKPQLEHSKVCKMDFENDSTISKQRFLKEFRQSLNPVYLQLIQQYEIRKHLEMKPQKTSEDMLNRYICEKTIGSDTYYIRTNFAYKGKNEKVYFNMGYKYCEGYDTEVGVSLTFRKNNSEIKLSEIDFNYTTYQDG